MTTYECLQCKANYCVEMATYYLKVENDPKLAEFYRRAAVGYKIKQRKLNLAEADD